MQYRQVRSCKNLAMSSNLYILLFVQLALWRCELICCSPRISTVELNLPIWVNMKITVEVWNENQKNHLQNHCDKQMRRITFNRCKSRVTNLCWTWRFLRQYRPGTPYDSLVELELQKIKNLGSFRRQNSLYCRQKINFFYTFPRHLEISSCEQ